MKTQTSTYHFPGRAGFQIILGHYRVWLNGGIDLRLWGLECVGGWARGPRLDLRLGPLHADFWASL